MSMTTIILSTTGAAAGMAIGNYLYEADKKANQYCEVPKPFYTVRKAAKDVSQKAEDIYNDIKSKFTKKETSDTNEELTAEEVEVIMEEDVTGEAVETETVENNESTVTIDTEVVGDKAVPVEEVAEKTEEAPAEETKESSNLDEEVTPKFTITDDVPPATAEAQPPEQQKATAKKPATKKATK